MKGREDKDWTGRKKREGGREGKYSKECKWRWRKLKITAKGVSTLVYTEITHCMHSILGLHWPFIFLVEHTVQILKYCYNKTFNRNYYLTGTFPHSSQICIFINKLINCISEQASQNLCIHI